MIDEEYSNEDFHMFLRLSRMGFDRFVHYFNRHINQAIHGKPQMCMIFLNTSRVRTLLDISVMFGVAEGAVYEVIRRVLKCVVPSLSGDFIK